MGVGGPLLLWPQWPAVCYLVSRDRGSGSKDCEGDSFSSGWGNAKKRARREGIRSWGRTPLMHGCHRLCLMKVRGSHSLSVSLPHKGEEYWGYWFLDCVDGAVWRKGSLSGSTSCSCCSIPDLRLALGTGDLCFYLW